MKLLPRSAFAAAVLALIAVLPVRAATAQPALPVRVEYNFNPGWKFIRTDVPGAEKPGFDDSSWADVGTPHTWNDVDSYRKLINHSSGDVGIYQGIGWYRKHFRLPASARGRRVFLILDGLRQAAKFYVNGTRAGLYENGVTRYGLDLTPYLHFGDTDNVIAVRVDNRTTYREASSGVVFQWESKAFNPDFGGINRDVSLWITGPIYQTFPVYDGLQTTGVYVYPESIDLAGHRTGVGVESQVRNDSGAPATIALSVSILDDAGKVRARFDGQSATFAPAETRTLSASGMLDHARFWDVDDPYLYTVRTTLAVNGAVVDSCDTRTGFRATSFRGGAGTGGVYLNGRFVWLTGYAQRAVDDWAGLGQAYPDWMHAANAELIRASHANYIRWMHTAPQTVDVRACDRFGIVEVCPAGDKEHDVQGRQWEQRVEVMRDTIIAYRNDPSILFWEAGNQVISPDHMREMVALRKTWDPHGGRVMGVRHGDDNAMAAATTDIAEYYGVMIGQDPRTDSLPNRTAIFRGYSAERRDRAPLIECEDLREEAFRGIWDNYSPPHFGFHKGPKDTYDLNSESFCLQAAKRYHEYSINRIDNPDPAHSKWSAYASIYWSDSDADGRQQSSAVLRVSGKVDGVRLPKEAFYVYRVMQNPNPDLHIIGHWTYPAGTVKTVYVAANHCDAVTLAVNGRSLGTVTTPVDGYIYAFPKVAFEPGTLTAIATRRGVAVAREQLVTAGPPAALRLTLHTAPGGLKADGSDVALIDFEVVDARGRRCPTDESRVNFAVSGPVIWRGGLNAGLVDSTNNLYLNTECGINRVAIRSTLQPGVITVTATRKGLPPATLTLRSVPVTIDHGLEPMPASPPPAPATLPN
ncbi:beta-galactosidase BoGH2A precursor [mine drainage metagenome]|uniref:Beta-galactosidase BoGH2A n=1 Tax=mine drainage metagenome TaxID=410659 RepID=A0A1J5RSD7_9ZZZZ